MSELTHEIYNGPGHLSENSSAMDEMFWWASRASLLAERVGRAEGVLDEVIASWGDQVSTHSFTCYQYHASCLAHMIKRMLEEG